MDGKPRRGDSRHRRGLHAACVPRSSHPLFGTLFILLVVGGEPTAFVPTGTMLVVVGTFLISWKFDKNPAAKGWWYAMFPLTAGATARRT